MHHGHVRGEVRAINWHQVSSLRQQQQRDGQENTRKNSSSVEIAQRGVRSLYQRSMFPRTARLPKPHKGESVWNDLWSRNFRKWSKTFSVRNFSTLLPLSAKRAPKTDRDRPFYKQKYVYTRTYCFTTLGMLRFLLVNRFLFLFFTVS